jgi:hypothetical protein
MSNKGASPTDFQLTISQEKIEAATRTTVYPLDWFRTSPDKIEIALRDYREALKAQQGWPTAVGVLFSLITTLVAATFNSILGLPANVWQAIYIVGAIFCVVWLIKSLYGLWMFRGHDIQHVIERCRLETIDHQTQSSAHSTTIPSSQRTAKPK